jgi:hypothetical protein
MASQGIVTFVWHGVNTAALWLAPPADAKNRAQWERAVKANKGTRRIAFRKIGTPTTPKSSFSTNNPDIIAVLRSQKGHRKIFEDLSALPVKCPFKGCEYTVKLNDQQGQMELALHYIEAHGDIDANNDAAASE